MPFNPALPQNNSPLSAAEMRDQLNGLKDLIDALPTSGDMQDVLVQQTAGCVETVMPLTLAISNPPTQAQVTAILDQLNELLNVLKRA